jgi:heme exporter protein C
LREKILYAIAICAGIVLAYNIYNIFMVLPDEASQGMIYRIMYFHIPSWWTALLAALAALIASVLYLTTGKLRYDAVAVSVTEVGVAFVCVGLATGMIWGRIIWGIWWTWDARLTSALICLLLYAGYLMLRTTIDEPGQRAKISAVFSIFAFVDVPIVWYSIRWWRTQHPPPMQLPPDMMQAVLINWLALILLSVSLVAIRMRQETRMAELAGLHRQVIEQEFSPTR